MNVKLLYLSVVIGMLSATCSTNKTVAVNIENPLEERLNNAYTDNSNLFREVSIQSRTTYPGVFSNLKGTTKYEISFSAEIKEEVQFKRLLVDSVALPFSGLIINGEKLSDEKLKTSSDAVKLMSYRKLYNSEESPQIHEVISYESTGLMLGNSAVIEYYKGDKPFYIEVEKIEVLPGIYAP